ncbi:MAG: hypothetical protein CMH13_09070 [Martelella sp.]|uniref:cell envelope integrity protein TolA n=1 Tax=unclassified Martelella TaxID=2629616 RepID=UPI000C6C1A9B|nr:hypothetical protein [Martelella sp.]MAU20670.1 hypothetical protein [Martelella sp.]
MKRSLAISFLLHCLVLGWAVFVLGAPSSLEVADVEALPVTLIPVEDITQVQQGDETAELADIAAPVPTRRPQEVAEAQNVGDNDIDLETDTNATPDDIAQEQAALPTPAAEPTPEPAPVEEPASEPPPPTPQPAERPEPTPEPAPAPEPTPEPEPAPAPEPTPAPEPAPAPEPTPEPEASEPAAETPPEPELAFPEQAPLPTRRPPEPVLRETRTAEAPRTDSQTTASTTAEEDDFDVDQIAALLNRTEATGGGAQRSEAPAAAGATRTTGGSTLSQSELDALRGQIQRNWSILAGLDGADDVRIRIQMKLDPSGAIVGAPEVTATGGSESARRILAGGARRAVLKASPFSGLPREKYDAWSEVIVNFDPSQML